MPIEILKQPDPGLITVIVSGKVVREDYATFGPALDALVKENGRIRILLQMIDFHGWDLGAAWEDLKLDVKHFSDIEKLAIVGETNLQEHLANWSKPFNKAEMRYFDKSQVAAARKWLTE